MEIIVLIPPYTTFSTSSKKPFGQLYIHFTAGAPFYRVKRHEIVAKASEVSFLKNFEEHLQRPYLFRLQLYHIVYEMLMKVPPENFLSQEEIVIDPRIINAMELMTGDFSAIIDNKTISLALGMSCSNVAKLFKRETGISPKHYRVLRRLEWAQELLLNSALSIEQIASQTGYADRYHFSKAFKQLFKIAPVEFRRNH